MVSHVEQNFSRLPKLIIFISLLNHHLKMKKVESQNKEDLVNEFNLLNLSNDLLNSDIKNSVFKLKLRIDNGKPELKEGTGFICNISNIKAFITNYHIISQDFLNNEKRLKIYNYKDEEKEINLELDRYIYANEELDFTIIEIIKEDNLNNYLEIDDLSDLTDYKDKKICSLKYLGGDKLQYLKGQIHGLKDNYLLYSLDTLDGSSGSPIILINNKKIIGLHKESYNDNKNNIAIPISLIFNKINYIKGIYNIRREDIGKEILLMNNEYLYLGQLIKNKEISNKVIIMINREKIKSLTHKFSKEGKYIVYYLIREPIINMSAMFCGCSSLNEINLSSFKTDNAVEMCVLFSDCSSIKELDLSSFKTNNVTNMCGMFVNCTSLEHINLSAFNTEKVTNISYMFSGCSSLKEIDLSSFKTENVTDMSEMFYKCLLLKEINLSTFTTDNVTNMSYIFRGCSSLSELDLSKFKTDKLTDMRGLFVMCSSLKEINLSSFKTDNVTDMSGLFVMCESLKEIDLSSFNTEKVTDMNEMFSQCSSLEKINLSSFNTEKVTDMSYMFRGCSSLTKIDLSKFKTDNLTEMMGMFVLCSSFIKRN